MACGAAAGTEVVEARGWRVPIYLGGGLVALAILGVILAIAALSDREETGAAPTPTPSAAQPPGATPGTPLPTVTPPPTVTATPTVEGSVTPTPTVTETPTEAPTVEPTPDDSTTTGGFTGSDGDYTIIIASKESESEANSVSEEATGKGLTTGVLNSNDYSTLRDGYWVVFTGAYATESEAEDALDGVKADYSDAYIKRVKQ